MAKVMYNKMKDVDLKALVTKRGIDLDLETATRKDIYDALFRWDIDNGNVDGILEEGEDGAISKKEVDPMLQTTRIIFTNTSMDNAPTIYIGHNGRGWYLPYEKEIDMPNFLLDSCIKDAVMEIMYQEVSTRGDVVIKTRKVNRFPYTVVRD